MDHWSELFPIIFLPLKIIVLGVCGFFAVKWHFDQEKKKRREAAEKEALANESADSSAQVAESP